MADAFDMLTSVKSALGITGDYQDGTLNVYIDEVNEYLKSAGVPSTVIGTKASAGVVARGVADLWNYGAGEGKLSPYFYERVIQLAAGSSSKQIDTTYSDMKAATSSAAGTHGLVPAPAAGKQNSLLRGDGTWAVPADTTYNDATASTHGLMSAADKTKLDGMTECTDAEITALFS